MQMLNRILAAAFLAFTLVGSAFAAELTAEQQSGLTARVESFDAAMKANNMVEIMGVVPPKVLEAIATKFGVTTEQLVEATQQQFDEAMKTVKLESFSMDLATAEIAALADGTPYALIPTETVMDLGAEMGKMKATSSTLGLLDGTTWYLVRVEDAQQVAILKEVYPAFADVVFPTGSMEPVTE
jgi:PBP1b-binding outer membrane lipoprotein LpoB